MRRARLLPFCLLITVVLETGCTHAPARRPVGTLPLDSATAMRLCTQPDSVLRAGRDCVLRDQTVPREFYRKP